MDVIHSALSGTITVILFLVQTIGGPDLLSDQPRPDPVRAERVSDELVKLNFIYVAPNGCWEKGETSLEFKFPDEALLKIVPRVSGDICTQALVPLDYSSSYMIPTPIEILSIEVRGPDGELVASTQMLIE